MTKLEIALMIAEQAHKNQTYGLFPYMYHIKNVLKIAQKNNVPEFVLIACVLHDVIENSDVSYNDISKIFGEFIANIVYCVTDELGRNRKERKIKTLPKIASNEYAIFVKLCDRIANVEHSKMMNDSMFKKYKQEYADFKTSLYTHNVDHVSCWETLDELLG
jgi:(p)ppGpp synthase/HD superfamily hydrolase